MFVLMALSIGIFAQNQPQNKQLTEEQKEQLDNIHKKYAQDINDINDELRYAKAEQQVLFSSKTIDEKAIYANIDKIGELRTKLQKQTLTMQSEMKKICPIERQEFIPNFQRGPRQRNGARGRRPGMQDDATPNNNKMQDENATAQNHFAQKNPQRGNANQKERMQYKKQNPERGNGPKCHPDNGMFFAEQLNLKPEQKTQIETIKKEHFWDIQETKNQLTLLEAQNSNPEDLLNATDEINTLRTKLSKQEMTVKLEIINVLTEEQRMKMIENREQSRHRCPPDWEHRRGKKF